MECRFRHDGLSISKETIMPQAFGLKQVNGTASVTTSGATAAIIAAQGAGTVIRVTRGVVSVTLAATGATGLIRLCDGTTTIMAWDANAAMSCPFDFGDAGYPLTANTALNLIVSGAGTNQASGTCACVALVA
jgi:hypothetical protein